MEKQSEPVKIQWTGDARVKLGTRYIESRLQSDDADTAETANRAMSTLTRQKTQIVIKSEQEANALMGFLKRAVRDGDSGRTWTTINHFRAFERVKADLIDALRGREWCGYQPKSTTINVDCPECGKTHAAKGDDEQVHCLSCGPFEI